MSAVWCFWHRKLCVVAWGRGDRLHHRGRKLVGDLQVGDTPRGSDHLCSTYSGDRGFWLAKWCKIAWLLPWSILYYTLKRLGNLGTRPVFLVQCVRCFLLVNLGHTWFVTFLSCSVLISAIADGSAGLIMVNTLLLNCLRQAITWNYRLSKCIQLVCWLPYLF